MQETAIAFIPRLLYNFRPRVTGGPDTPTYPALVTAHSQGERTMKRIRHREAQPN